MKSTAGILTLCFVLSVNLCAVTAHPVHTQCKLENLLGQVVKEIEILNSSLKVHHIPHNAEITHHLTINKSSPILKQNKSAACSLHYMEKALEQVQDHQSRVINNDKMQSQLQDIITRLKRDVSHCTRHILAKCDNPPEPKFPESHFKAKQWTRNLLESSVNFLRDLIVFLENSKQHEKKQ